ncbi:MAG: sigma-70 family RNA polymerase sigma factor [Planctomycetia bacterium]|nr:sigma-70 family RNA polymerase sigma factor [Planctomycetia bacterium]
MPQIDEELRKKASKIFLEQQNLVRIVAFRTAPSSSLLGDIANEVFITFVEHANQWDFNRDLRPLLKQITRNIAMRFWRDHLKNLPSVLQEISEIARKNAEEEAESDFPDLEQELLALRICMKKLAPKYRSLIESYYFGKITLDHLAEKSRIKPGTLRKMMSRIRDVLKNCIQNTLAKGDLDVE